MSERFRSTNPRENWFRKSFFAAWRGTTDASKRPEGRIMGQRYKRRSPVLVAKEKTTKDGEVQELTLLFYLFMLSPYHRVHSFRAYVLPYHNIIWKLGALSTLFPAISELPSHKRAWFVWPRRERLIQNLDWSRNSCTGLWANPVCERPLPSPWRAQQYLCTCALHKVQWQNRLYVV